MKLGVTMSEEMNPWADLPPPAQTTTVSGRRVDPSLDWALYWAVDADRSCMLILQHSLQNEPRNKLPKLRGLEIEVRTPEKDRHALLVIRLKDNEQREVFHRLCLDIVEATRLASSESEAIERFIARTWRWHWLLRGGRDARLDDEEQKGLIGELRLMDEYLFPDIGPEAALHAWRGPLDAPKDFEVGRVCVEVKARRGAATPFVVISSEHQLDTAGVDCLFLNVSEITGTSVSDPKGSTITEVARGILDKLKLRNAPLVDLFEERLLAAGFDWAHDYTDRKWLLGPEHFFEVNEAFPRITPDMYPAGIRNVRYAVSLLDCEPFRSTPEKLSCFISGGPDVDQS